MELGYKTKERNVNLRCKDCDSNILGQTHYVKCEGSWMERLEYGENPLLAYLNRSLVPENDFFKKTETLAMKERKED